jgi:hypothetical protein
MNDNKISLVFEPETDSISLFGNAADAHHPQYPITSCAD